MNPVERKSFRRLWSAALLAGQGAGIRLGVMPLMAAVLSSDPLDVAVVAFAGSLPWLVVGPVTGVLVDRYDHRRTLVVADCLRAGLGIATLAVVWWGGEGIAVLAVLAFLFGSIDSLRDNAAFAIVPAVVGERDLVRANSGVQTAVLITEQVSGPPLGVLLFGVAAILPWSFATLSFAAAALLIAGVRGRPLPRARRGTGIAGDVVSGLKWLLGQPLVRKLCLLNGLFNIAVNAVLSIAVLYSLQELGVGQGGYALLLAVIAAGAVAGAAVAPRMVSVLGEVGALRLVFAVAPLGFLVTGLTSDVVVAGAAFVVVGLCFGMSNVLSVSLRHELVPANLLGRVNSAYRLLALGAVPLGNLAAGVVAHEFGLHAPFLVGAALLAVACVAALRLRKPAVVPDSDECVPEKDVDLSRSSHRPHAR